MKLRMASMLLKLSCLVFPRKVPLPDSSTVRRKSEYTVVGFARPSEAEVTSSVELVWSDRSILRSRWNAIRCLSTYSLQPPLYDASLLELFDAGVVWTVFSVGS